MCSNVCGWFPLGSYSCSNTSAPSQDQLRKMPKKNTSTVIQPKLQYCILQSKQRKNDSIQTPCLCCELPFMLLNNRTIKENVVIQYKNHSENNMEVKKQRNTGWQYLSNTNNLFIVKKFIIIIIILILSSFKQHVPPFFFLECLPPHIISSLFTVQFSQFVKFCRLRWQYSNEYVQYILNLNELKLIY